MRAVPTATNFYVVKCGSFRPLRGSSRWVGLAASPGRPDVDGRIERTRPPKMG